MSACVRCPNMRGMPQKSAWPASWAVPLPVPGWDLGGDASCSQSRICFPANLASFFRLELRRYWAATFCRKRDWLGCKRRVHWYCCNLTGIISAHFMLTNGTSVSKRLRTVLITHDGAKVVLCAELRLGRLFQLRKCSKIHNLSR